MALRGVHITLGAAATSLATEGVPDIVSQLDIQAGQGNSGNVLIGDATVAASNAWGVLTPGKSWGTESEGVKTYLGVADVYITGTQGEYVHILWVE